MLTGKLILVGRIDADLTAESLARVHTAETPTTLHSLSRKSPPILALLSKSCLPEFTRMSLPLD